ncbi:transporter substrate-binding domain-containing protein [Bradyrhizobium sp. C-145]|uniref:transporter substrate-binding domain-containing protein n=1 Tax=Bradyrhizobium sp. C-145 TaxID=574727 RepID=UPI00201B53D1|nr:transporter substrate-binding domain-containing protein [Bradyrhizobium sp. C-145]UQR61554.1 transporter substrate-binding domain-containing protein [Bradyrhizobium sp. C-145]
MSRKINLLCVLSGLPLAATLVIGTVHAHDVNKVINAAHISTYYPPLEFKDPKSGELVGFAIDLFEAMAKKVGAKVNWSGSSFAELTSFAPLKTGRVDIYASGAMTDTPERRENGVSFLDFVYEPYFFFTLKANADQFKSPDGLCGKRVATTRSSTMTTGLVNKWSEETCAKAGKPAVVQVGATGSAEEELMLKQGRVDAAVAGVGPISHANQLEGNTYITLGRPLNKNMYGMAFLNEKKELGEALKKALDELIADGTYVKLLQKWGLPVDDSSIGSTSSINAGPTLPK